MPNPNDWELLNDFLQRGDERAFESLVQRHGPMVMGVCRRRLGSAGDCDDAFQAVFIVLARRAATLKTGSPLSGWLYGVTLRVTDTARQRRNRDMRLKQTVRDFRLQPEIATMSSESLDSFLPIVDQEIERLPEKLRLPFVLCCIQNQSQSDVATALGCTADAVRGRVAQARKELRINLMRLGVSAAIALLLVDQLSAAEHLSQALVSAAATTCVKSRNGAASAPAAAQLASACIQSGWRVIPLTGLTGLVGLVGIATILIAGISYALMSESPPPHSPGVPQLALAPVDTAATAKREDSTTQVLAPEKQNGPATPLASYFETKRRILRGENLPAIPAETLPQPVADGTGNLLQVIPVRIEKLLVSDAAMMLQKAFNVSIELSPIAQEKLKETTITLDSKTLEMTGLDILNLIATKSGTEIRVLDGGIRFVLPIEPRPSTQPVLPPKPKPDEF